jgi:hypothetical protein
MSDNFESSLINLGELSKPATVLVEKISDAVGGIFKPYQIVRVAKAEAQAARVRAEGEIEISDIQRRAFHRFLEEEAKKQKNIEDITQKSLPLLTEDSKPNEVEDDWITYFCDRCRLISSDEMQSLWSRVLAGEANKPGTYSKRTVNFLSALDKNEAEIFTRVCNFAWHIPRLCPLIYNDLVDFYEKHDLFADDLRHLESIGLLSFQSNEFHLVQAPDPVTYHGAKIRLDLIKNEYQFCIGVASLTKVGEQLAPICATQPVEGFFDAVVELWRSRGYISEDEANKAKR